jgi:hypothetical protein
MCGVPGEGSKHCRPLPTQPQRTHRTWHEPQQPHPRARAMQEMPRPRNSTTPTRRMERQNLTRTQRREHSSPKRRSKATRTQTKRMAQHTTTRVGGDPQTPTPDTPPVRAKKRRSFSRPSGLPLFLACFLLLGFVWCCFSSFSGLPQWWPFFMLRNAVGGWL